MTGPLLAALLLWPVPAASAERQRALLLASGGPVVLELRVLVDGKPFFSIWEDYLNRLFADLDRDGSGALNQAEAARAPSAEFLASFLQGGLNLEAAANLVAFASLDVDNDGCVSRGEFLAFYRRCAFDRLRIVPGPERPQTAALSAVLMRLLDRNRDGRLSKAELRHARTALNRVDLNEDEWITPEELLLHASPAGGNRNGRSADPAVVGFLPIAPGGLSSAQRALVRSRYPGFEEQALAALLSRPPAAAVVVRLGSRAKDEAAVDRGRGSNDGSSVGVGGLTATFEVGNSAADRVRGLHAFYRQQFEAADAARRGFIEHRQAEDSPTLAALFPLADRNGDGRLTEVEFVSFLDLHAFGATSFVVLTVTDTSPGLFELLDEDGDGRLSLRELYTAPNRLAARARASDGFVKPEDLPHALHLRFTRGSAAPRKVVSAATGVAAHPRGSPAWFQKMDRNNDGFVSRREFLGPKELFDRFDLDGDGLLSPAEARRLDMLDSAAVPGKP